MRDADFLPASKSGLFPPEAAPGVPVNEYDFDRLLVFYNPVSENVKAAQAQIADLEQSYFGPKVDVKQTVSGGHEANQDLFAEHLREGDIFVLATGDGTLKTAIQTVAGYTELSEKIRRTPILPLGGGNANDMDVMLNDSRRRIAPSDILEAGRIVSISPVRCSLDAPGFEPYEHFAGSYVSLGTSARAAYALNQRQYRQSHLRKIPGFSKAHEFATVGRSLQDSRTFVVEHDNEEREVAEILFPNGSRMAKYCRFPSRLTERGVIYHAEIGDLRPTSVAIGVGGLLMNRLTGEFQTDTLELTAQTTTFIQFDGESEMVYPGTRIAIGPADVAFRAITTRVRP